MSNKKSQKILLLAIILFFNFNNLSAQESQDNQAITQQDFLMRQQQNKSEEERLNKEQETLKKIYQLKKLPQLDNQQIENSSQNKCLNLKKIIINGAKNLDKSVSEKIISKFLVKCFDKKIAQELTQEILQYYRDKGLLTVQVFIPKQNIQEGLIVEVVEGSLSKIIINKNSFLNKIEKITAFGFIENKPLNINNLNQGLFQINRLASNKATLKLEPDEVAGQTKVLVLNQKKFPIRTNLNHDNFGIDFTGVNRTNFNLNADNLLSLNDSIAFNYTKNFNDDNHKKDLKIYGINFAIPFAYNNFSYDFSRSEFLGTSAGSVAPIKISGFSNRQSFNFERLIYNQKNLRLSLFSNLVLKSSASYANNVKLITSQRKLSIINLGLIYSDYFKNNLSIYVKPTYIKGLGVLNSTKNTQPINSSTPLARFEAYKFYVNVAKKFNISGFKNPVILATEIDSQYAKNTLYGSEQMAIGGYYSVRGFRENYVIGDHGYLIRNKININLADSLEFLGLNNIKINTTRFNSFKLEPFFDYGWVKNYYNSQSARLSSTGLKTIFSSKHLSANLTYAQGLNRSKRFTSSRSEKHLILFELSAGF